ncbi:NusG domain II-containing protein [Clostridium sp.]|uniref:NusG domain II-containing protein n=1 Tax=Clostridium sp. TaxID=1506 RepID=UPI003D6D27F5
MKKGDKIVVIVLLITVIITFGATLIYKNVIKGSEKIAVIKSDGKIVRTIDLNKVVEEEEITIKTENGHYNIILVKHGSIRVKESDCLHKECVKIGTISEPGKLIICLPNKLTISINGEDITGIDGATY